MLSAHPVSSALIENKTSMEAELLYPLLGTPILTKNIKEHDIVLFAYDNIFSHIIPHGKEVLKNCAQIATENQLQALEIPAAIARKNPEKILNAIPAACQTLEIYLPALTIVKEATTSKQSDLFAQTVRVAIPRLTQCSETLVAAINQDHQEIVDLILQNPVARHNIQLHTDALQAAAKANDTARVQSLLAEDSPLSFNKEWFSAMAVKSAAACGHIHLIQALLNPTFISQHIKQLVESLQAAAKNGNLEVLRFLLAIPELKAQVAAKKNTVFRVAAANGHLEVVRELLAIPEVKAQVAINFNEAFRLAAENGHIGVVRELLAIPQVKVQVTAIDNGALRIAATKGQLEVVGELLIIPKVIALAAVHHNEALRNAAANGHLEVVRKLLAIPEVRAQATALKNEALKRAAQNGHLEMVRELLAIPEVKAQVTADKNEVFVNAAANGHLEVVRELLAIPEVKAQVTADNNSALKWAAANGHPEVVRELLAIPQVKANATAGENEALKSAALKGHLEVVRELLTIPEVKAMVTVSKNEVFRYAAQSGRLELVRLLLDIPDVKAMVTVNNNEAFRMAALDGRLEVVRELLTIPEVKALATVFDNTALCSAAEKGHLEVVRELLAIPEVKARVTVHNNIAFRKAAVNGHLEVVRELLAIPQVKDLIAVYDNEAFRKAAEYGHFEVVRELLTFPEVSALAAANSNEALKSAVDKNNIDLVCELLQYPVVRETVDINDNEILKAAARAGNLLIVQQLLCCQTVLANVGAHDNAALGYAIAENRSDVINLLLTLKAVKDKLSLAQMFKLLAIPFVNEQHFASLIEPCIRKQCLSQQVLWNYIHNLKPAQHQALVALQRYLQYYGYQTVPADLRREKWLPAMKFSIKNSFADYFSSPTAHAGKILQAVANVEDLKQKHRGFAALAGNTESAMEESLVDEAIKRFKEKIEPAFHKRFTEMGGVEGIEPQIIGLLLEKKVAQLRQFPTASSAEIIHFIENNKSALMRRETAALVASRQYFTSHTDIYEIAFRAFDDYAPSHGWEKLFVAPKRDKENSQVFSTRSASEVALTLKQTTDITRHKLCYAYVMAQDESLNEEERASISEALVHYLAEISRAHNNTDNDSDNPSCYPGTITRLDLIFQNHPEFRVEKELFATSANIAGQLVVKAFNTELELCKDKVAKLALYEAITLFSQSNAREILHQPGLVLTTEGEVADLKRLLSIRKAFFEKYFGPKGIEGIHKINAQLKPHQLYIDDEMTEIALLPLINMSCASPSTTYSLTEAYLRAMPAPSPLSQRVINPYKVNYEKILQSLNTIPSPQKEQVAKRQYTENRIRAVYFKWAAQDKTANNDSLKERSEEAYQAAREAIIRENDEIDINAWSFTEQMITALMRAGIKREMFPTQQSIDDKIRNATVKNCGDQNVPCLALHDLQIENIRRKRVKAQEPVERVHRRPKS